jgi:DNA-binding PadR family transcriptional regulator
VQTGLRPLPISDPDDLRSALENLPERDRRIIELRYGLKGARFHSRAELGRLMGLSRERIRQLEVRALDRLAHPAGEGEPYSPPPSRAADSRPPSTQSFLRCWTLLLLWLQPGHVYELRGRLAELGLPTAFYRTLQGMEEDGLLRSSWAEGRGAGPRRRVYSLTERGVDQLQEHAGALARMSETLELFLADEEFRATVERDGDRPPSEAPGGRRPRSPRGRSRPSGPSSRRGQAGTAAR